MPSQTFIITPLPMPVNTGAQSNFNQAVEPTPREISDQFTQTLEKAKNALGLTILKTGVIYGQSSVIPWAELSLKKTSPELAALQKLFNVVEKTDPPADISIRLQAFTPVR